tara:strand:- start:3007 stop:3645 length:639 start_codon:yes stop_codon:yes gene_type:complete
MINSLIPDIFFLKKIIFSLGLGILINVSLIYSGQKWAKNFSYAMTCCILPMTSLVITKAISGNIALSLGMVGALSIVRFRHPVKSPLELALYFLLVTVGVSTNVSPSTSLTLVSLSMLIIYLYAFYISNRKGFEGFIPNLDINDHSESFLLELKSNSEILSILNHPNLVFFHDNIKLNAYCYKLKFENIDEANLLVKNLDKNVISERKLYKV